MPKSHKIAILVLSLLLCSTEAPAQTLRGRWIGQDAHDFVGPNPVLAPSGVQDIHLRIDGLPPADTIDSLSVVGLGADEWRYQGDYGPWKAHLVRTPRAPSADLFLEPTRPETGRPFTINIRFESGRRAQFDIPGGHADPSLRMPSARLSARWVGQKSTDLAGPTPSVGPDGLIDAQITLDHLVPDLSVKSIDLRASDGSRWSFGLNPDALPNAEFLRDPQSRTLGRLDFQPLSNLDSQTLRLTLTYANNTTDSAEIPSTRTDPHKPVPAPSPPKISPISLKSHWLGQITDPGPHLGWVRLQLSNLPEGSILAAALSDPSGASWLYRSPQASNFDVATYPLPLEIDPTSDPASPILLFPPVRDESSSTLTLRLLLSDARQLVADLPGGPADPEKRAPQPAPSSTDAHPGDDLQALVNRFGTVRLSPGLYRLNRPLILSKPCHLVGQADGVTLRFEQPPSADPWTAAIKVHAGSSTLERFSVRFSSPVRWQPDINYGPAVIGTTDNLDQNIPTARVGIHLRALDLESPPPSRPWEESPRLARLVTASCGSVRNCRLRGGIIEFSGGPWTLTDNLFRGVPPNAFSPCVFAGHSTHDLLVARNRASSDGPSGKTWRFLVLTNHGSFDRVEDNTIADIGPRDDDTIPGMNSPEIILTESYHLRFEGRPLALFLDGRLLIIPDPQGDPAEPGDAVSLLDGPHAGQFVRIAQRLDRHMYLLSSPLPSADSTISVSPAFWSERFERNRIDALGSSSANGFVLAGNHFGTLVKNNTVLGTGVAMRLLATPSESPRLWGWSHNPFLGVTVEGNTLQDNRGLLLSVEHGPPVKTTRARLYQTVFLRDNLIRATRKPASDHPAITIGDPRSLDPSELRISASGNVADAPSSLSVLVHSALVNNRSVKERTFKLPPAPKPR